tara:strand:+ start:3691 stop:3918 length:228 start_codon:yes stop_codon:yes gene_type:complete
METHKDRLLNYLKEYKRITSLDAIRDLGNTRLAAYIFLLKEDGHNIKSESHKVATRWKNEDGTSKTTTVVEYILN